MVRALDIVKLGKEVMTSRVRASRDLQGTIDLGSRFAYLQHYYTVRLVYVVYRSLERAGIHLCS